MPRTRRCPTKRIFKLGVPVLGICYGLQLLAQFLGGKVEQGQKREYGKGTLRVKDSFCPLFAQSARDAAGLEFARRQAHQAAARVSSPSAVTENSDLRRHREPRRGKCSACNSIPKLPTRRAAGKSSPTSSTASAAAARTGRCAATSTRQSRQIRAQVGNEKVILGLSGGVDSSVAAALLHKAIGDQLTCIFVNNGVLRGREAEVVREVFGRHFKIKLQYEDASKLFLQRLKGVTDPERKRKIIGRTFIEVFEAATKRAGKAKFLAQGTLYPDVIESVPIAGNPAAMIKSHHNVGGLPKKMKFQLVEPLKCLFKDEVRELGLELGLPREIVLRQPFPGPGLAVRILGEVTPQRLRDSAQRRHHRRRGDEEQRLVLQDLAELRRAAARAQRRRHGRRADLRLHHRHSRRGIAGRHDGGLGEAARTTCWKNSPTASSTKSKA